MISTLLHFDTKPNLRNIKRTGKAEKPNNKESRQILKISKTWKTKY